MPTLRFRRFDEIPPEDQEHAAFLRARMRGREDIDGIFGAQAHWPAYMAANHKQALASYQFQGVLPQLAKEAMHVAISMSNGCNF
jgi:alkylhydroperoxidase family enzyme